MYNGALVEIPVMADNKAISFDRLSDERALELGHRLACFLSESEGAIVIALSDGRVMALDYNTPLTLIGHRRRV